MTASLQRSKLLLPALVIAVSALMLIFGPIYWFDGAQLNIGSPDPHWDYLAALIWAVLILTVLLMLPLPAAHKRVLVVLWIARIGVTLGFMLFYEASYGLDAYHYYHSGAQPGNPWGAGGAGSFGDGTANLIGLSWLHQQLLPGSYHALKLTSALIGLIAIYLFYRTVCLYLDRDDLRVLWLLGLFPSILFWSSILGKDPITLLGVSMYCLGVVGFVKGRALRYLVIAALGLALAAWIRVWLAAIFVLPLAVFVLVGRGNRLRKAVMLVIVVPALAVSIDAFSERFQIETTEELVERTDALSQGWARGGAAQHIDGGFTSTGSMLAFLPVGMFTALFRPLPGEVLNPFGVLAGVENLVLLSMLLFAVWKGRWRHLGDPVLAWAAALLCVWAAVYGFVSFQNLGTAFRFKLQVMPILALLCFALWTKRGAQAARKPGWNAAVASRRPGP
jgi:hypothetical protein